MNDGNLKLRVKLWERAGSCVLISTDGSLTRAQWIDTSRGNYVATEFGFGDFTLPAWLAFQTGLLRGKRKEKRH
jgi:hypothetical protein